MLDEEHISFIIDYSQYYYKVIPFGLKTVGVTYQRLVNKMFTKQIEKYIEVYIDDMLMKSKFVIDYVTHFKEMFSILHKY